MDRKSKRRRPKTKAQKKREDKIKKLRLLLKLKEAQLKKIRKKGSKFKVSNVNKNHNQIEVIVNNNYKKNATRRQKKRIRKEDQLENKAKRLENVGSGESIAVLRDLERNSARNTRDMLLNQNRQAQLLLDNRLKEINDIRSNMLEAPRNFETEIRRLDDRQRELENFLQDLGEENNRLRAGFVTLEKEVAPVIIKQFQRKAEQIEEQRELIEATEGEKQMVIIKSERDRRQLEEKIARDADKARQELEEAERKETEERLAKEESERKAEEERKAKETEILKARARELSEMIKQEARRMEKAEKAQRQLMKTRETKAVKQITGEFKDTLRDRLENEITVDNIIEQVNNNVRDPIRSNKSIQERLLLSDIKSLNKLEQLGLIARVGDSNKYKVVSRTAPKLEELKSELIKAIVDEKSVRVRGILEAEKTDPKTTMEKIEEDLELLGKLKAEEKVGREEIKEKIEELKEALIAARRRAEGKGKKKVKSAKRPGTKRKV